MTKTVPLYILSGFLGSGKTTLLKKVIAHCIETGKKPAVIINEIGDVNLDGLIIGGEVAMAEMLNGCICCTLRGNLGSTIQSLYDTHNPDIIFIESTGIGNPMEMIEGVTESSLLLQVELKSMITVVDAPHLQELSNNTSRKSFSLMKDQIRYADRIILNKTDRVTSGELSILEHIIGQWNPYAPIQAAVYCGTDMSFIETSSASGAAHQVRESFQHEDRESRANSSCGHVHAVHQLHDHVMAYTHYFDRPVDGERFRALMQALPAEIFRAKGILHFRDSVQPFLFQYAYREVEFIQLSQPGQYQNVAVFIGETFSKQTIKAELDKL